jgi:hypothetical protein
MVSTILDSHGGEYEDGCILGCNALQPRRQLSSPMVSFNKQSGIDIRRPLYFSSHLIRLMLQKVPELFCDSKFSGSISGLRKIYFINVRANRRVANSTMLPLVYSIRYDSKFKNSIRYYLCR